MIQASLSNSYTLLLLFQVYVQEIIRVDENGKDLVADIENGGHLYVCGGTTMGSDVMEVVRNT